MGSRILLQETDEFAARTSLVTVYDTISVYDVTASIGPFNASYVDAFIGSFQDPETDPLTAIVPYAYTSVIHNLITNSLPSASLSSARPPSGTSSAHPTSSPEV